MASPELKNTVIDLLKKQGTFSEAKIIDDVAFFTEDLGMPSRYFARTTPEHMCKHILSLEASKIAAEASGHPFDIQLRHEEKDTAFFGTRSYVTMSNKNGESMRLLHKGGEHPTPVVLLERLIERKYLLGAEDIVGKSGVMKEDNTAIPNKDVFRLQAFRSTGQVDKKSGVHLRLYLLQRPDFVNPNPDPEETDIHQLGDKDFLKNASKELLGLYQNLMTRACQSMGPAIETVENFEDGPFGKESMVMVAHNIGTTHSYFTGIPDVYRYYNMFATRKFVEPFSNGIVVFSFLLQPVKTVEGVGQRTGSVTISPVKHNALREKLRQIASDASLHYVLPRTSLTPLFQRGILSPHEVTYAYCAWKFAFHFLDRGTTDYHEIVKALTKTDLPDTLRLLGRLRQSLKTHAFTEMAIKEILFEYPEIIKRLYHSFCARHSPTAADKLVEDEAVLLSYIRKETSTEVEFACFAMFVAFNKHILKTNFFKPRIVALSFRLDADALPMSEYPERPFGLFLFVGAEFRGFHVRFRDVARGGIRLVRSAYPAVFARNTLQGFDECYDLASTQQRKNKDIPEGGSKGIIILSLAHQDKGRVAFEKLIDSMLDIILPDHHIVDHYKQTEILFLGPDEGTADFMDWASAHARARGYPFWKAFTTGKSPSLGGIPHDTYGMTTHSVRSYVTGIQEKVASEYPADHKWTKVQTGGPDGDLGSNEIKLGNEATVAVVDGSGVLYDQDGINSVELKRLANDRKMIDHFDNALLGPKGFKILITDNEVTLPSGEVIDSGLPFRNGFHHNPLAKADFFVPCGGRPKAVNIDNVDSFFLPNGEMRFKYIVEGANLFFTQEARLKLEKRGVIMFKDASANKGGVTSSSLEVLAALCFTDEEFSETMQVVGDQPPPFYATYVTEVQQKIRDNAKLEFECIWREHNRTGLPRSVLSDELSMKITKLSVSIEESDSLWNNTALRTKVLEEALPNTLIQEVGFDIILERLPINYQRALFASRLASRFIYQAGLETPEFAFFEYVDQFLH